MKPDLLEMLSCPARDCGSADLSLNVQAADVVNYRTGPMEEVREGSIICGDCGRSYPIEGYVPSFEQLFPDPLKEEADYWSKWYGFLWDQGYLGFFDLRAPMAPHIIHGVEVLDPATLDRRDLGGTHSILAGHPLLQAAEWVLDIGCGTGWSSLFLARRGHKVVAFDPSTHNMRLAKRYAISQGEYVEYLGAAMGFLAFKPDVFDAIFALHSIHHVPELKKEMAIARDRVRDGGAIAVDEHIRNNPLMEALAGRLQHWAHIEVYPKVRTLDLRELHARLPKATHSSLEDSGSHEVVEAITENFVLQTLSSRYVSLDAFSFLFYLSVSSEMVFDQKAYTISSGVIDRIYRLFLEAFPNGAEYITMVGVKDSTADTENDLAREALSLSNAPFDPEKEALERAHAALEAATAEQRHDIERLNATIHAKNGYIEQLERTLSEKNQHILRLEGLIRRLQRQLSPRPVQAMVRVTKNLPSIKRRKP